MKGIVSQSVKEVLQSLVDDGLVQSDKIGSSNFFWSFPSQQGALIQSRLGIVKEQRATNEAHLKEIKDALETEKALRVESEHRTDLLNELSQLKGELCRLDQELNAYGACDPVKLEETKRAITLGKEAAIRWTDNYGVLLSHFTRQTGVPAEDIRKYLEIGEDYEDIC
ncbi:Meiotic nuclear division protein 1 [Stygiomarasmius scandens]|uniref:Meiotic nuclear division protein 1 n=1 Tax=Marasmiellus scandens TaxID=2682957 RepID=A0ABR1K833_9AGAR